MTPRITYTIGALLYLAALALATVVMAFTLLAITKL